jgi:hypothetical protein
MNEPTRPPCRLYVLLARSAPVGVVFRRGPSEWVRLVKWNTADDSFEPGQWFRGRVYERRCDLSPDGTKLVYFASKFNEKTVGDRDYTYAWTAVSRPPYFTALALWPKGDCWAGGGLFEDDRTLRLNHGDHQAKAHPDHLPRGLAVHTEPGAHGEDGPILDRRLARDGWRLRQRGRYTHRYGEWKTERAEVWEKPGPRGATLVHELERVDFREPGGPYVESVAVELASDVLPLGRARWADWDHRGRLVVARDGKLLEVRLRETGPDIAEIADLSDGEPERIEAPEWARRW